MFIPLSRARAMARGVFFASGAILTGLIPWIVAPHLNFRPSAISNQLEDFALAFAMLPLVVAAVWLAWRGLRWLATACWPRSVGVYAGPTQLILCFGPFGTYRLNAARLKTTYLFELSEDEIDADRFEAFLPEEQQIRTMLPRMSHPDCPFPIRERLLAWLGADESVLAGRLAAMIDMWRRGEHRQATGRLEGQAIGNGQ